MIEFNLDLARAYDIIISSLQKENDDVIVGTLNKLKNLISEVELVVSESNECFFDDLHKKSNLNQKIISRRAKKKYLKDLALVKNKIDVLYDEAKKIEELYPSIFEAIDCVKSILTRDRNLFKKSVRNMHKSVFPIALHAASYDARYILCDQKYNFLQGGVKSGKEITPHLGGCYGHVKIWEKSIYNHMYPMVYPTSTLESIAYQKLNFQADIDNIVGVLNLSEQEFRWCALTDMLSRIDDKHMYRLAYSFKNSQYGHSVGLRKLANNEIEFYDPNLGLFVFRNESLFVDWLVSIINKQYPDLARITFCKAKKQAKNFLTIPCNLSTGLNTEFSNYAISFGDNYSKNLNISFYLLDIMSQQQMKKGIIPMRIVNDCVENAYLSYPIINNVMNLSNPILNKNFKYDVERFEGTHGYLISKVTTDIDIEINRLKKTWVFKKIANDKIMALHSLRNRLQHSNSGVNLTSEISAWMEEKSTNCNISNKALMQMHRGLFKINQAKSQDFVNDLVLNFETNPLKLELLQEKLIHRLASILDGNYHWNHLMPLKFYGDNGTPTTIIEMRKLLAGFKALSAKERHIDSLAVIDAIKAKVGATGFFTRIKKWRSDEVDYLYDVIKNIDAENPASIVEACRKLENFEERCLNLNSTYALGGS